MPSKNLNQIRIANRLFGSIRYGCKQVYKENWKTLENAIKRRIDNATRITKNQKLIDQLYSGFEVTLRNPKIKFTVKLIKEKPYE